MDTLNTNTGVIELAINGDPNKVIAFDPTNVIFAEKFYKMSGEFTQKMTGFQTKAQNFKNAKDENGVPVDVLDRIALVKDLCLYIHEKIDELFGAGTSEKAFGDSLNLEAIKQFFDGITPYFKAARSAKVNKYSRK